MTAEQIRAMAAQVVTSTPPGRATGTCYLGDYMLKSNGQKRNDKLSRLLGWVSLITAVFAAYEFIDSFGWVIDYRIHPVHLFDFPSEERNSMWVIPCTASILCGLISRKTVAGKVGIVLSLLVLAGIMLMVHWGIQMLRNW